MPSARPPPGCVFPELQAPVLASEAFRAEPWGRGRAAATPALPAAPCPLPSRAAPADVLPPETCGEKQRPGSVFSFAPDSSRHTPAVPPGHALPRTPFLGRACQCLLQ